MGISLGTRGIGKKKIVKCVATPQTVIRKLPCFLRINRFNIRQDVLIEDLVKCRSREIGRLNYRMAVTFDKGIGSSAADVPVKF